MPDLPPFDLDSTTSTISEALIGMVAMSFRAPGNQPNPAEARALMAGIRNALLAGTHACAEITRMRHELAALRDGHRPQPHADPMKPGALCAACSVHGSIVSWPCATWSAAERILTHGKA
ncbi:hypothetical protein ME763_32040 [Streptomyces murinus]|uniref:hypothetical protein n=1 Tax=Streptomyces murinus TaxID=33900 RepID=UPI000A1FB79A|nr:hypothetical protein [Streptomyces murinus]WDO09923.1 hypothetical protein ME763_32040 [Streptomyces murinus]